ncbi:MAG: M20/M25/M40 family metallo-hydrolase [Anaerolineae bacterium]|nr:M20/M25/M40 family metallo-hydrolase [Anaerolineae bacterium]
MIDDVATLARHAAVRRILDSFEADLDTIIERAISVQQIAAPTFAEARRADYIEEQLRQIGLADVQRDEMDNVYGRLPGSIPGKPVVISAHSDTVFSAGQDLRVVRGDGHVAGPGIADNSLGVAALLTLAETMRAHKLQPRRDIWFVSNVGEEGLGDLRGMRAVVEHFGAAAAYLVLEGGLFGFVCHEAIGVRRYRITVQGPGGHSWGAFGTPSAIHVMAKIIAALETLPLPAKPKTTYNAGVIEGGTTVNTIARCATMLLDLRSAGEAELAELVAGVEGIVEQFTTAEVRITLESIGERPAGRLGKKAPLVQEAVAALRAVGHEAIEFTAGSTDANIPLSRGYPAVCIGITRAANTHRPDEYMETAPIARGIGQALLLLLAAAGLDQQG